MEMSLVAMLMLGGVMNAAEVARYALLTSQVAVATQAGAQAAYLACDMTKIPATLKCPGMSAAVQAALRTTSLGDKVTMAAISEAYYCISPSGPLQQVGTTSSRPSDCSAAGDPSRAPALYLQVRANYTYEPIFEGLTVAEAFPQSVARTAWMRMG